MIIRAALITAAVLAAAPADSAGDPLCLPRADAARRLSAAGERAVAEGLTPSGGIMEIYASRRGSWTIVFTTGNISCRVAGGTDLESPARPLAAEAEVPQ